MCFFPVFFPSFWSLHRFFCLLFDLSLHRFFSLSDTSFVVCFWTEDKHFPFYQVSFEFFFNGCMKFCLDVPSFNSYSHITLTWGAWVDILVGFGDVFRRDVLDSKVHRQAAWERLFQWRLWPRARLSLLLPEPTTSLAVLIGEDGILIVLYSTTMFSCSQWLTLCLCFSNSFFFF